MENLCDQQDCDGNQCNGVMFEAERVTEIERESITDNFLRCKKCGYERMTMRRTKFSGAVDPHTFNGY